MSLSDFLGRCCCGLGLVLMLFGSFLVPVNAPAWADPGNEGEGGGGGAPICVNSICAQCGTWVSVNGNPEECYDLNLNASGKCLKNAPNCGRCTGDCEKRTTQEPGGPIVIECVCSV